MNQQKKKILCLHGNGSNKEVHTYQLRQLMKELNEFEFIPLDGAISINRNVHVAQVMIPPNFAKMVENKPLYTWGNFYKLESQSADGGLILSQNLVFKESLDLIIKILKEQGPFYAVLSFSQGTAVAARLATLIQENQVDLGYDLKGFIFASGGMVYLPQNKIAFCKIPTVHLIGLNDFVFDRSLGLATQFLNPLVIFHDQGHKIPTLDRNQIKMLKQFFNQEKKDWLSFIQVPKL